MGSELGLYFFLLEKFSKTLGQLELKKLGSNGLVSISLLIFMKLCYLFMC